jgi:TonB-linked SusC/RagA family outer membrane protein
MKLTFTLLLLSLVSFASVSYSQATKLTFETKDATIESVFKQIESLSEYKFAYNSTKLNVDRKISLKVENQTIDNILDKILGSANFKYQIVDRYIIITEEGNLNSNPANGVQAATKVVGKVTDSTGAPLPGVSVVIKGSITGTITDSEGNYTISNVPANASLLFSFVGMKNQQITVAGKSTINVTLVEETVGIEEVVAIGYGTQKKRNVTGAMSQIKTEELADIPVANIGQKMQGKFAGVQIYQTSGEPNGGLSYRIRGQASINGGNSPLVVIDGFPSVSGMESLSPDEIESVSILKDASATSLYGSRAANGVILVTTKGGKSGVTDIEFSAYYGTEKVLDRGKPDVMNASEFAQFKKEYYEDKALYEGYTGGVPAQYQNPQSIGNGTDWYDILLRNAKTKNYNLSVSSGIGRLKSSVNVNYNKQEGVILNTFAERYTARANNLFEASDRITFGLNIAGSYRNSQITPSLGNGRNIIGSAFLMDPALKYKNDDGTYPISYLAPGMFANPNYYLVLTQRKYPTKQTSVTTNGYSEIKLFDGLKYKLSANVDLGNTAASSFIPSTAQGAMFSAPPKPATGNYSTANYMTWLLENTLTYTKTFKEKHNIDALLGYTSQDATAENSAIAASSFPDDEVDWFNAATVKTGSGDKSEWSMLSYIGRLNYNYDGKYIVSLAFRRDGCSRFGSNAKYGNFPSVSLGWIASDENFMKGYDKLSYLKLRASYGKVGNNNIGNYSYIASVVTSNYVTNSTISAGRALNAIGNNDLTWETTVQTDFGFDLGLFKDRIFLVYDYYHKKTDGLLYAIDIPNQSGFSSIQSNIGEFKFWGHEFGLETKNMIGKFRWNTNFNITFNRNEAVKLGTNNTPIGGNSNQGDYNRTQVGHPLGEFMGYVYDGVYMTQQELDSQPKHTSSMVGTVRMKDISGPDGVPDGKIDMKDRTIIGDPNPDFLFGITNEFNYKNFDASVIIAGAVGGDIIDATYEWTENIDGVFNVRKEMAERWRSIENPGKGNIPRTRSGTTELFRYNNTRWVSDGSYLAVKNLTLGYTLPIKSNPYIKSTRFYLSAQNVFMLTNYHGMNPEVSANGSNGLYQGVDSSSYPIASIYTFGINVKF